MTVKELAKQMKKELNVLRKEFQGMSVKTKHYKDLGETEFEINIEHRGFKPELYTVKFAVKEESKEKYCYSTHMPKKYPCVVAPGKYIWTTGNKYFQRKDGTFNYQKIIEIIREKLSQKVAEIDKKIEEAKHKKKEKNMLKGIKIPKGVKVKLESSKRDEYTIRIEKYSVSLDMVKKVCKFFQEN